jgi:RNA polymerase subunit RPABC4/transcription elongation factor Spt4
MSFTFCKKCNRVIDPKLTDDKGRCPDCTAGTSAEKKNPKEKE